MDSFVGSNEPDPVDDLQKARQSWNTKLAEDEAAGDSWLEKSAPSSPGSAAASDRSTESED